ncbi:MAG TPA: HAMP domain-containing sensor histidine kinase [Phnomibacter sp.]|nr:HAMP domain-containing sensor histidine kinase [Phnomibacter sp.]
MIFKTYQFRLGVRTAMLFAVAFALAFLFIKGYTPYACLLLAVVAWQVYDLYMLLKRAQDEVQEFAESVHYRDFSRYFNVKKAPSELQPLRMGFNEINTTFKEIRGEKEMQYQYLQKILELVDTGILSFKSDTKEINWINDSFKRMLDIPYMRTIDALEKRDPLLYEEILAIKPGESKIVGLDKDGRQLKLLVSATVFQTEGVSSKIVAFQNVNEALDETESKAWQKLLSVMTHEIMNSVAPISSLANTLGKNLHATLQAAPVEHGGDWDDLQLGLDTIKRRSEGLLKFAESYRSLNKITQLNLQRISVSSLFENLTTLMSPTLDQKNIQLDTILKEPQLAIVADPNLLEQVLINLLVNAIDAVKENESKLIVLSAYSDKGKVTIKVADNGPGIESDVLDKIFIPFFSTKKTGSGIGLSLCKQIMLLHKGSIHVQSVQGQGTAFAITL